MNPTKLFPRRATLLNKITAVVLAAAFALSAQGAAPPFDRKAMLENVATNVISPCYEHFADRAARLSSAAQTLVDAPEPDTLNAARAAWNDAAFAWAQCEPYGFGGLGVMIVQNQIYKTPINPAQIEKLLGEAETPGTAFDDDVGSTA